MEDVHIIELFWKRSQQAISVVQDTYGNYLRSIASRILRNREDTEECVNDTLLRAWNTIPPKRPECLRLYLGTIARNRALDKLASNTAGKRCTDSVTLIFDELEEILTTDTESDITDSLVIKEAMDRFLRNLPPESRLVFLRRYWYFCSIREIAQNMSLSESKVKMSLSRTRSRLKDYLKQDGITI